jgi:hypothetical protein
MAKKISDLSSLGAVADADVFVVVDDTDSTTKKVAASAVATHVLGNDMVGGTDAGDIATIDDTQTLTNKTLTSPVLNTGVSGTAVLDEDDMATDSATQIATQQSIKAYVDNFDRGVFVDNSNGNPNVSDTLFSFTSAVTEDQWWAVYPTGGSPDETYTSDKVVWTPLTNIPTDVDWIEVKCKLDGSDGANSTDLNIKVFVRNNGDQESKGTDNTIAEVQDYSTSAGQARAAGVTCGIKIPVTSRCFDIHWETTFTGWSLGYMVLTGYGWNS